MANETHPVFRHNKCPKKGCGITEAIIMNNECLYCLCDWFARTSGEEDDDDYDDELEECQGCGAASYTSIIGGFCYFCREGGHSD